MATSAFAQATENPSIGASGYPLPRFMSLDDEVTNIVRKFVEIRYQLLPYLYTAFWKYIKDGTPLIKSLVLYDQNDVHTHYRTDEFIYGDKILVCPINEANSKGRRMYFPEGNWYNFWNNEVVSGGKEAWVDADIDSMPIFIKEGAVIPKFPLQQYVGEKEIEKVVLDVYYKEGKEVSRFYDDAHDGYDYTKGRYSFRTFKLKGKSKELIIQQHKEGKYNANYEKFKLKLHGLPFKIKKIQLDNEEISLSELEMNGDSCMIVNKEFGQLHIIGE